MIYFCGVLLWISQRSEEIASLAEISNKRWVLGHQLFIVLEELDLTETLFRFFASLVRAAEILAFLFGDHLIAAFYFLDHSTPS
jgi:hypothetical protein